MKISWRQKASSDLMHLMCGRVDRDTKHQTTISRRFMKSVCLWKLINNKAEMINLLDKRFSNWRVNWAFRFVFSNLSVSVVRLLFLFSHTTSMARIMEKRRENIKMFYYSNHIQKRLLSFQQQTHFEDFAQFSGCWFLSQKMYPIGEN